MWVFLACAILSSTEGATPAPVADRERVLVTVSGLSGDALALASSSATQQVAAALPGFDVSSDRDVAAAVELEAQRQLGGCSDEACVAEIAGALGARWVVSVVVVGDGAQAIATLHDTRAVQVIARSTRDGAGCVDAAAADVARALSPSAWPVVFGVAAGGAAAVGVGFGVAAVVFAVDGAGRDGALARIRDPGDAATARAALDDTNGLALGCGIAAGAALVVAAAFTVAAVTVD